MQSVLLHMNTFYESRIEEKIEQELKKVPMEIDPKIRAKYKHAYLKNPLSFQEFLDLTPKKSQTSASIAASPENGDKFRKQYVQALEKKKIEEKKSEQLESFDDYEKYFSMTERELERAKRKGSMRRKYQKKTRRGKY